MMEETPPQSSRCRLCLTTFHDQSDDLLDIFRDQEADFSLKIRDCTGVFVSPEDDGSAATTICTNCTETVHFIAEFRDLCRRSEERCVAWFDSQRWEAYRHHVGELRRLLSTTDSEEGGYFKPMVAVKLEQEEQRDDVTFEWADAGDVLEMKHEVDDGEGEGYVEEEEDVPKRKKVKVEPMADQMALAKVIHKCPVLWDSDHKGFHDANKRELAWTKLASLTELDKAQLKREYNRLHEIYRRKRWNTESSGDELYQLLESMFNSRKVGKLRSPITRCSATKDSTDERLIPSSAKKKIPTLSPDERMKLAEAIYEREIIWNRTHPNYNKMVERDGAFEELAVQMNIPAPELRQQWKVLRDLYRLRSFQAMEGKLDLDDPKIREPLYLLLKRMLRDNMEVGKRSTVVNVVVESEESTTDAPTSNAAAAQNEKLALAQAFYEQEFIWNRDHPQNQTKVSREAAWKDAAKQFNMSVRDIKNQWRYLRDGFRVKWKRLQARPDDESAIQATLNPLYTLMEKMVQEDPPATPTNHDQPNQDQSSQDQPNLPEKRPRRFRTTIDADLRFAVAVAVQEQEILWNQAHPEFADHAKRDRIWQQVATQLSIPYAELKNQWKLLRDLYRGRIARYASGKIPRNHPVLRQKLFGLLDRMLRDNMNVGSRSKGKKRLVRRKMGKVKEEGAGEADEIDLEFQEQNEDDEEEEEAVEKWGLPFQEDKELRARLADEITKHEILWNVNHVDYNRGSLRGQVWTEISNHFGLDRSHVIMAWRRAAQRHRSLIEQHGSVMPELLEKDPLHRMLHEVVYKTIEGEPKEQLKKLWPTRRRYTGKKKYSDEGCFKVIQNGTPHYFRVCELCGKNVERSDFEYHMNRHNGLTPYACSYEGCDKQYASKITRDRHEILVHTSDAERFECEDCGEKFKYRSKLEYHHAINHKSQNLPCPTCGKELKHKQALRTHMQKVHQQSGFGCSICNRVYQTKFSLNVHMRIHTNEKPFPCVLCGQCFRLKVLLKTHLAKKHNVAIEELEGPGPSGSGK